MKERTGFVSNSSSASFIVLKSRITSKQADILHNHLAYSKMRHWNDISYPGIQDSDAWIIEDKEDYFECRTSMVNFNLPLFCDRLKIPVDHLEYIY